MALQKKFLEQIKVSLSENAHAIPQFNSADLLFNPNAGIYPVTTPIGGNVQQKPPESNERELRLEDFEISDEQKKESKPKKRKVDKTKSSKKGGKVTTGRVYKQSKVNKIKSNVL